MRTKMLAVCLAIGITIFGLTSSPSRAATTNLEPNNHVAGVVAYWEDSVMMTDGGSTWKTEQESVSQDGTGFIDGPPNPVNLNGPGNYYETWVVQHPANGHYYLLRCHNAGTSSQNSSWNITTNTIKAFTDSQGVLGFAGA